MNIHTYINAIHLLLSYCVKSQIHFSQKITHISQWNSCRSSSRFVLLLFLHFSRLICVLWVFRCTRSARLEEYWISVISHKISHTNFIMYPTSCDHVWNAPNLSWRFSAIFLHQKWLGRLVKRSLIVSTWMIQWKCNALCNFAVHVVYLWIVINPQINVTVYSFFLQARSGRYGVNIT